MKYNNTKIVNAFAGPGAGKTTACLEIVSQLKMRGKSAEYVPEYAKELVWDERTQLLDGSLMNQLTILCEQYKRIKRLFHKVDYIVTDSPYGLIYCTIAIVAINSGMCTWIYFKTSKF